MKLFTAKATIALVAIILGLFLSACDPQPPRATSGGNAANGRTLFASKACGTCHIVPGMTGAAGTIGPTLDKIGTTAATRRPNMTAAAYLDESIKDPAAFVVDGYPAPAQGGMILPVPVSEQERRDLVAFLLDLK